MKKIKIFCLLLCGLYLGGVINGFSQENSIEILKRLSVRISPEEGGGTDRFLESPLRIWEGINGEIIFLRGDFIEILLKESQLRVLVEQVKGLENLILSFI